MGVPNKPPQRSPGIGPTVAIEREIVERVAAVEFVSTIFRQSHDGVRDATRDSTHVPQPAPLPPRVASAGAAAGRECRPARRRTRCVTKIVTYNLLGNGGMDMRAHVGHTVEILGDIQEIPVSRRAQEDADVLMRQLRVVCISKN